MVEGFAGFGFPKAHGAAFGLLAYQSTWLRVHYGPEFLCALLNEQPMGFYAPDSLVHEAETAGIPVLGLDVNASQVECTVEDGGVRLGLGYIKDVRADEMRELVAERERGGPFASLGELAARVGAGRATLEQLAWSGACDGLVDARWDFLGRDAAPPARPCGSWESSRPGEVRPGSTAPSWRCRWSSPSAPRLRPLSRWQRLIADYATSGVTVGDHVDGGPAPAADGSRCSPRAPSSRACRTAARWRSPGW